MPDRPQAAEREEGTHTQSRSNPGRAVEEGTKGTEVSGVKPGNVFYILPSYGLLIPVPAGLFGD